MQQEQAEIKICKVLKLSNGETIVGNISKETVSYIDVELPLKILIMMHPQSGKMQLSILKWDPTFDYTLPIRIYKTSIVACADPTDLMLKNYSDIMKQPSEDTVEENKEDEITELNDMMNDLLNRMRGKGKGNTFH